VLIDTNIPDVASVQDLQLYIGVQGIAKDITADFTIWFEPGPDEGPLKGVQPGRAFSSSFCSFSSSFLRVFFMIFVCLKRSVRAVVDRLSSIFSLTCPPAQNKLENISFRSGGKKAPR
jgi:hypothetical protein